MEIITAIARLLASGAPQGDLALPFAALLGLWATSEFLVGKLGLDVKSMETDRGSAPVIVLTAVAGFLLALLASAAGWLPAPGWVPLVGLTAMTAGLALRLFSIMWLGKMFTRMVQIVPDHRLVTSGPYRLVRHPSYSGLLLFFAGIGLALGDWLSVAAALLVPSIGIAYRIRVEEGILLQAFGEEYRAYMRCVRAVVPFVL